MGHNVDLPSYSNKIPLFQNWRPHSEAYSEPCETSNPFVPNAPFLNPPENIRKPYRLGNGGKTLAILAKSSILMFDMVVNTP